jgi:hypothetical protein
MFEQWPVCDDCGGRLDHVAGQREADEAAGREHNAGHPARVEEPAGTLPVLTQPPFLPAGETLGQLDMTEFENAHRND